MSSDLLLILKFLRLQKYDDMVLSCVLIMSWNEITQLFAKLRKSRDN